MPVFGFPVGGDEVTIIIAVLGAIFYVWKLVADYRHRMISLEEESERQEKTISLLTSRFNRLTDSVAASKIAKQTA